MQKPSRLSKAQQNKLKKASWSVWLKAFNDIHNSTLNTSIGIVNVETKNKKK